MMLGSPIPVSKRWEGAVFLQTASSDTLLGQSVFLNNRNSLQGEAVLLYITGNQASWTFGSYT